MTQTELLQFTGKSYADANNKAQSEVSLGPITIKEANRWMKDAAEIPTPVFLWKELFIENEVCCLFADTNVGKSVLAVQIARDIALSGRRVLYMDFELTHKQFEMRYIDADGEHYEFPDNLLRCEISLQEFEGYDFENSVVPVIAEGAKLTGCDVIIIDNLTWLTSAAEHAEAAGNLMKQLLKIKKENNFSVLVIAHTPKRPANCPISINDLAGSKQLINFFDSSFSIGRSARDERLRYIKQIKARSTEIIYGSDNVITCEIEKIDKFLCFVEKGTEAESRHLTTMREAETNKLRSDVQNLREQNMSLSEIAKQLNVSKTWVHKILKSAV